MGEMAFFRDTEQSGFDKRAKQKALTKGLESDLIFLHSRGNSWFKKLGLKKWKKIWGTKKKCS